MSFILTFDDNNISAIINELMRFEKLVLAAEPIFKLEGRRIEEIMRVLPHHLAQYDQALQEVKGVDEWLNNFKDKITAKYWKKYLEGYQRTLATRDIQAYIAGEKEIVEINQVAIEVTLLKNKLSAIVEALKQMGWMCGHMTKLRVAEMQDAIL